MADGGTWKGQPALMVCCPSMRCRRTGHMLLVIGEVTRISIGRAKLHLQGWPGRLLMQCWAIHASHPDPARLPRQHGAPWLAGMCMSVRSQLQHSMAWGAILHVVPLAIGVHLLLGHQPQPGVCAVLGGVQLQALHLGGSQLLLLKHRRVMSSYCAACDQHWAVVGLQS